MQHQWQERMRPLRMERRFEFPDYETLRDFLDRAAEVSEQEGLYPDMGFGRDYVNVTIYTDDESDELGDVQQRLAKQLDALLDS
jgi:pterin-4a-carbinolamine dehydratase